MAFGPLTNVDLRQLFKDFGANMFSEVKTVLGFVDKTIGIFGQFSQMASDLHDAIGRAHDDLEDFKTWAPPDLSDWKTRVISLPIAWKQLQDFFHEIVGLFTTQFSEVKDAIQAVLTAIEGLSSSPTGSSGSEAEGGAIANLESQLAVIQIAAQKVTDLFIKLVDVADTLADIKDRIESASDVFLSQSKKKVKVKDSGYHWSRRG